MGQPMKKDTSNLMQTVSPVDGSVFVERAYHDWAQVDAVLTKAKKAQKEWRKVPLAKRQ